MRKLCAQAAAPYRLCMPRAVFTGASGDLAGLGTGASLELLDLRDYVPGDDIRHLDWRAYARCDRLQTRLYRAEVAPWVDIIVDTSASMAVSETKAQAARDLLAALAAWAVRAGGRPRVLAAGGDRIEDTDQLAFSGEDPQSLVPAIPLRRSGVRVVVTDWLREHDPAHDLAMLSSGAARLVVIQLLDAWEQAPEPLGPVALVDCESDLQHELEFDDEAVRHYRDKLTRLQRTIEAATRNAHGAFVTLTADSPQTMFPNLLPATIIEPFF